MSPRPPGPLEGQEHKNGRGLLTAVQVAEILSVPESWVRRESRAGRLPCIVLGHYKRYRLEAVETFIESRSRGPVPGRGPGGSPRG